MRKPVDSSEIYFYPTRFFLAPDKETIGQGTSGTSGTSETSGSSQGFDLLPDDPEHLPNALPEERQEADFSLPAHYGTNVLFLIGRDPKFLFCYWDVDWIKLNQDHLQPHLRLFTLGGHPMSEQPAEAGETHWLIPVPEPGLEYYLESGYWSSDGSWHTLARSAPAPTAHCSASRDHSAQFATMPFHMSFERLNALVSISAYQGEPLTQTISRLQTDAVDTPPDLGWTPEQRNLLDQLLGEALVENYSLDSAEIERLLRRALQELSSLGFSSDVFPKERWNYMLQLASGSGSQGGS